MIREFHGHKFGINCVVRPSPVPLMKLRKDLIREFHGHKVCCKTFVNILMKGLTRV